MFILLIIYVHGFTCYVVSLYEIYFQPFDIYYSIKFYSKEIIIQFVFGK